MSRFTRIEVVQKIAQTGVVPVFFHEDVEICKGVLEACYQGGIRVFEFTNRGDFAHEIFGELNKFAAARYTDMTLGAGTIFDAGTAALYMQLGASFIVSPVLKEEVAFTCNRRKVAYVPGCATMNEISRAEELGAEMVKIFPGNVVGPEFIKSLKGPMPWTSVIVTGGVEPEEQSLTTWFKAGVKAVGIGSQLFPKEVLASKDFDTITGKISTVIELVKKLNPNPRV
jgi:2-dehydro-3-deoxyphosphogluconate aldolase/(4S)-4-hydroxy-2-oxoglutarate aldolase